MKEDEKQSQELIMEVEEDVSEERFLKLWRKYKNYLFIFISFVLLGFLGDTLYEQYNYEQSSAAATIYDEAMTALEDNRTTEAMEKLTELEEKASTSNTQIYRIIAQMQRAELLQKEAPEGSFSAEAMDLLWGIAQNTNYPLAMRHMATYMTGLTLLDHDYEKIPRGDIKIALEDIAAPGNQFQFLANELLAQYALHEKDYNNAKMYCERVMKDKTGQAETIKARCGAILSRIANQ